MSYTINPDIYNIPTLNIGILGCISTGKSTLMNSLFAQTYSDMKIKKTTMCPQVYQTDKKIVKNKSYAKDVRKQNEELNKKLYDEGTANKCEEILYQVLPIPDIFDELKNGDKIEYRIYDIPGLNDSATKNIFYDYVRKNFYKFDVVIYNIDINSGLNTTDELDILNLIKSCVTELKTKYNKEVKLIIICNKCDDMRLTDDSEIEGNDEIEEASM
jgi:GTPase Era involved in 16S rRNA processing